MSLQRYAAATLAVFVFIVLFEFGVHGFLFRDMYQATAPVWRAMADLEANIPMHIAFQFVLAAWIAFVFIMLCPGGGVKRGLLFGLCFGVFAGILTATWFVWLPVPAMLSAGWFLSSACEGLGAGLVVGLIYRG